METRPDTARPLSVWDLDGTLLRRPTFTPFLIFSASRLKPWRLVGVPVWFAAMAGYAIGLWSRKSLKQFGLWLFLRGVSQADLDKIAESFADRVWPHWLTNEAREALANDRAEGRRTILATAAMGFYARVIARRAGFDHIVSTAHFVDGADLLIEGDNCYGPAKLAQLLDLLGPERPPHVRAWSDSLADAPLLDWADDAVLVGKSAKLARIAAQRGWRHARL